MDYTANNQPAVPRFVFYQPIETVVPPPPKPLEVAFYAPVETIGYRPAPVPKEIRYTTWLAQPDSTPSPRSPQSPSNRTREGSRYASSPSRDEPAWSPPTGCHEEPRLAALTRVGSATSSQSLPIRPREEGRYASSPSRMEPVVSSSRSLRSPVDRPREEHRYTHSPRLDPILTPRSPQSPSSRSRQETRYTTSPTRTEPNAYSQFPLAARSHEERYATPPGRSERYSRSSSGVRHYEERYATPPLRGEPTPSPQPPQPQRSPPSPVSRTQEQSQYPPSSGTRKLDWDNGAVPPQTPTLATKKTIDWGDEDSLEQGNKKSGFLGFGGDSGEVKETQGWWKKRAKDKAEAKAAQAARDAAAMPKPAAYKTAASAAERVVVFF